MGAERGLGCTNVTWNTDRRSWTAEVLEIAEEEEAFHIAETTEAEAAAAGTADC